jgi:hypothetical protein
VATLQRYIVDTQRLIRDRSAIITPVAELTDYINEGRRLVCRITGCLRALIAGNAPFGGGFTPGVGATPGAMTPGIEDTSVTTFATIPSVEKYHFDYARPFLQAQYTGFDRIIEVIDVAVTWNTASRPVMDWVTWDELQALYRIYSAGVFTYPFAAAKQGDGVNQVIYLAPVPGQALEMEWDCSCVPKALASSDDYEAIPEPFSEAVKYAAAMRAFMSTQRYGSADMMRDMLASHLGVDRVAVEVGGVPSYYY